MTVIKAQKPTHLGGQIVEKIQQLLGNIQELSEEELSELKEAIVSEFKVIKEQNLTSESASVMQELSSAALAVKEEFSRREAELAQLAAVVEEASANISALETPSESEEAVEEEAVEETAAAPMDEEIPEEEIDPETGEPVKAPEDEEEFSGASSVTEELAEITVETTEAPAEELSVEEAVVSEPTTEAELAVEVEEPQEEQTTASTIETETEAVVDAPHSEASVEDVEVETPEQNNTTELSSNERDSEDQTVTASIESNENQIEVPEANRPQETPVSLKAPVSITAGADIPGITMGSPLKDLSSVAQALFDRKKAMGRTSGGDGEQHTVAVFSTTYPEDRVLSSSDADANFDKISKVTSPEAIVAAGGLLAPVETSYDIFGLEENLGRPVKDSLAVFNADRGGIRFLTPVQLSDLDGAASLWTLDDDIAALVTTGDAASLPDGYSIPSGLATVNSGPAKPCIRVTAGGVQEAFTDAIPLCITFGNIGARTFPEMIERHVKLGLMWHARYAEQRLITRISTLSTQVTTTAQLGVGRDLLVAVNEAAAGYRNRHRMADNATLRVIFPAWLQDAVRADFTKQLPGDGVEASLGLAVSKFEGYLRSYGINITWAYDGESDQYFGAQAAGALNSFPADLKWYLFAEGTFLFLDGGTLDLGIVRDSTLNATNDYKMFLETFEGLAKVGVESLAITTPVNIWGAVASTVDTTQ